ncbi:MAG TPA: Dyp-type peroxidase [Acidimicrobiales bacterium]|nr:Dyp-type peroxidase [Acidimicrobiales bacterium]
MTATPQPGIFAVGTRSHHHLELDVDAGADPAAVLAALRGLRARATTVAGVNLVVGVGSRLCRAMLPDRLPAGLGEFETLTGADGATLPGDQHDLWIWLHSHGPDAVFDTARRAAADLSGLATVVAEQPSFTYQASRDLTGFEDGTENPPVDEAPGVATVPAGLPGAGGSVVLLQRWVHDLDAFDALDDCDKDQVIGRCLVTGEELPEAERSPRAHLSRVVIDDPAGEELEIFRRSTAFGGVIDHGLMFVAFSADVDRLDTMLRRMVGAGDGVRDRLTDISRCAASAWYVAPPVDAFAGEG